MMGEIGGQFKIFAAILCDGSVWIHVLNIRGCNGFTPLYPETAHRTHLEYGDIMVTVGFSLSPFYEY